MELAKRQHQSCGPFESQGSAAIAALSIMMSLSEPLPANAPQQD